MPPPRRKPCPAGTGEIFVNREASKKVFEDAVFSIPADRSIVRVFYGIGGQGKSALCRELLRATNPAVEPSYAFLRRAELDLHRRPKTDPDLLLVWIRNGFASAGVAFPAFDLALAIIWQATRGEEPFPSLENAWLAKSADTLVNVAPDAVKVLREVTEKTVETIPGLGILITKGSKWVIDKTKRAYLERTRPHLQELCRSGELKKLYELSELLPWMLAQDLNHHLADHPAERFVLFIDEYEGVFDEGGAGARWRENLFDRHMREFVRETNGLLAAFFPREKLPWGNDPDWRADLDGAQHLIGGLTAKDADEWLRKVPIEDPSLRKAIIDSARESVGDDSPVYPLLLELQIEHGRELAARGNALTPESFYIASDTFEGRCTELVQRVLRDYGDELQVTLERLSVANRFDRAAFQHVVSVFGTGLPFDSFERIAGLSFITKSQDGFLVMHRVIADAIQSMLSKERYQSSTEALLKHYESRAAVSSPRDVTDHTISALFEAAYLRRQIGIDGYVDWLNQKAAPVQMAARFAAGEQLWRETLHLVEEKFGEEHPSTAASYNNVAYNLNAQGRYEEAEPLYRKALDIRARVLGEEHPDTAASYNNVASNLNAQGRYEEAEPLYRKALDISERVLGEEHPSTAASYNNVAYNLNAQGRYEEAEPLYRKALDIRARVLGEEHPQTRVIRSNLQKCTEDKTREKLG